MDELAGRLEIDPIELRRRNLVSPDDEMADGTPWGGIGLDECLARLADHPLYRDRASLPGRRGGRAGRRGVAGWPPAGLGDLPSRGRRPGDGRDRRGRHLGHDDRLRHDRRRGAGHRRRRRLGGQRRHRLRPALPGQWRERHHVLDRPGRPAGDRCAAREDPGLRGAAARDRRPRPRARRRLGPAEGDAGARPDAWPRSANRSTASPRPSSRSRARAAPSRRSSRRSPRPTSSTSGSIARPAPSRSSTTSSPRTSAGRSTPRSSRASSTAAPRRASAGRSTRRWSTTRPASC